MSDFNSPERKAARRAHADRATAKAKAVLKPGDWLQYTMCGGVQGRAKFTHWDGIWACSRTKSDIHALNIFKVNGQTISFRDDALDPRDPEALE